MADTASVTFVATPETGSDAPKTAEQTAADAAAAARATATQVDPNRPAWLPQNFKSIEEYVASNEEARKTLTQTQQELATLKKGEKPAEKKEGEEAPVDPLKINKEEAAAKEGEQSETDKAAAEAVAKAGLDVAPWQTEFNETRDVSEEGRAKIAEALKAQFGDNARALVDDFIEGQRMRLTNFENEVFNTVGGKEKFAEMAKWAGQNLSDAELAAYNKATESRDLATTQLAVTGLKAKFEAANGKQPELLDGDNSIGDNAAGFASVFEMTQAMSDKRYAADPVYRKSVEQKAMRSKF